MGEASGPQYKLRSVLHGHSMDVKWVSACSEPAGALLSASRDKTARLWYQHEDLSYSARKVYRGHTKYVSCAVYVEPTEEYPSGLIYTGCQDGKIRTFLPDLEEPLHQLDGHAENVTSIYAGKFGTLISGSWDMTAKVWVSRRCSFTLTGHTFAVWAVAILPEVGVMVTASADKTIKLWKAGKCEHTLAGHTDAVRALAVVSSTEFLSASNDASVRRWSSSGDCLGTYYGHTNYIYSLALLGPGGDSWVTGGEDRSVRVWRAGEVVQTLYLPAISVWSVAALENGDIAAATNDGCLRLFTQEASRTADPETIAAYEEELSKLSLAAQQELGGIKLTDLPGPEALFEPGRKDGQQKMVRQGEAVSVHSWSMAEQRWDKIGDVVGAAGGTEATSGKKLYKGKEYDYVFDIEIDEPKCTLKLPYNTTDDPYMAAQKFIHDHDMSQSYLDEIAAHITRNTGGQALGTGAFGNTDPLTGGSSYAGGGHEVGSAGAGRDPGAPNPWMAGAYVSGSGGVETGQASQPVPDPWMQGAYRTDDGTGMETDNNAKPNNYFPITEFLQFNQPVKAEAMTNKMKEFNALVPEGQRLEDGLLAELPSLATAAPSSPEPLVAALGTMLTWPDQQVFPALDLARAVLLCPATQDLLLEKDILDKIFSACLQQVNKEAPAPAQMLALRCLANMFSSSKGEELLRTYRDSVLTRIFEKLFPITEDNKNIQIAAATLALNYAVSIHRKMDDESQVQLMSTLCINFFTFITDWEARFRTLVAAGTMLTSSPEALDYAKTLEAKDGARGWRLLEGPSKVSECAAFIEQML
jgi:phospholipase A-2-activating protein